MERPMTCLRTSSRRSTARSRSVTLSWWWPASSASWRSCPSSELDQRFVATAVLGITSLAMGLCQRDRRRVARDPPSDAGYGSASLTRLMVKFSEHERAALIDPACRRHRERSFPAVAAYAVAPQYAGKDQADARVAAG